MTRPQLSIVDQWTGLAHKELLDAATATRFTPTWVPSAERRRLAAYLICARYLTCSARDLLPASTSDTDRRGYREYGDPAMLVDRVVAAVLGDGWTIGVDGASGDLTSGMVLPDPPADLPAGASALDQRVHAVVTQAWEQTSNELVEAWEQAVASQPRARLLEAEVRAWADRVMLAAVINDAEHDAVGLGDGAYVLWPQADDWPKVTALPPDAYFPVLPEAGDAIDFPDKVVAAWEYETTVGGETKRWVRRQTWELVPVTSAHVVTDAEGSPVWDGGDAPLLSERETVDSDGAIVRAMPWHSDGDTPATVTCWHTDGTWSVDAVEAGKVDALADDRATWWDQQGIDLGCDFLPVIHVPNTPAGQAHFGESIITRIAQVLDDLAQNDTDTMSASGYLGDPTIALAGANPGDTVVAPGRVFGLGEKGSMSVLDLSAGIEHLMTLGDRLADRAGQSAGVPREVVGRADADSESGIHLALKLAPFAQMVASMRMARAPKYRLLLRQAVKLAMLAGQVEPGPVPSVRLVHGPFLPTDQARVVTDVSTALAAGAMSTTTAVTMLSAAGVPVGDVAAEVAAIHAADGGTAKDIADATGSEQLAADYLGVELPTAGGGEPPAINLP